jgi:hypothetical protein
MSMLIVAVAVSRAATCPNEDVRLTQEYGARLPDCRAYEQVTPVEKNFNDVAGRMGLTRVSPDGERVTFGSLGVFAGAPGSSTFPVYLAERVGSSGWSTQGLTGATGSGKTSIVEYLTNDLSYAVDEYAVDDQIYLYATGSRQLSPFPFADEGVVDESSDDSTFLFVSQMSLRPKEGSKEGVPNLYEWKAGQVILVAPDAVAGPAYVGEAYQGAYTEDTISADGSRVFYTSLGSHRIFMREDLGGSLGSSIPISEGPAEWLAATPDGSSVLYTSEGALYRWTDRTGEPTLVAKPSTGSVVGTLGISNDGTYVYFVTTGEFKGKLAGGQRAGEPVEEQGKSNLYEWREERHEERPSTYAYTYIATLGSGWDPDNWLNHHVDFPLQPAEGFKTSQVTPDGRTLMFTSQEPVTYYPNPGQLSEIYRYDAERSELTCVSCNPSGKMPSSNVYLSQASYYIPITSPGTLRPYGLHNMSDDGQRLLFETEESLLPQDENPLNQLNHLMDVYEWENGHLYLISCGCEDASYIGGDSASYSGSDVFFFTRAQLVAQDQDEDVDLYDAREAREGSEPREGGILAQNEVASPSCEEREPCMGVNPPPPSFSTPISVLYSGVGNVPSSSSQSLSANAGKGKSKSVSKPKCKRGYRLGRHRRCVKAKAGRHR